MKLGGPQVCRKLGRVELAPDTWLAGLGWAASRLAVGFFRASVSDCPESALLSQLSVRLITEITALRLRLANFL